MAKRKRSSKKSLLQVAAIALGALVGLLLILILTVRAGAFGKLPTAEDLAALRSEEGTLILASDGAIIGKVFAKDRTNIRYRDLPKHLVEALVATEDQRFFAHEGVDARSYVRVIFRSILGGDRSGGGGSTISQQIIKNLYGREPHGLLTVPVNKIKEAIVARRLEKVYTKEDVLELYFNSVPFGENLYGVESASQRFFNKNTSSLTIEESAVLVGMLKANTSYNPRMHPQRSRDRRDQVFALMAARGYITTAVMDSLVQLPLRIRYRGLDALDAYGYFCAQVEEEARAILSERAKKGLPVPDIEKDGLRIETTLDTSLQQLAIKAARDQLSVMQPLLDRELTGRKARISWEKRMDRKKDKAWKRNERSVRDVFTWNNAPADSMSYRDSLWHYQSMLHGAVLMMDPGNGNVLAWVGGNDHRMLPYDLVEARRPIASTIKPVLYAAAIEDGLAPCDYLDNADKVYRDLNNWHPQNFDESSGGQVTMWYALAHSMNLPTIDLYFHTDRDVLRRTFRALGLPEGNINNPSLALGAVDVSLKAIVRAYGAFARQGRLVTPRLITRITDAQGKVLYQAKASVSRQALSATTAAVISAMLRRAVNEGTGTAIRTRYSVTGELAGKTGTSQDFSDAWFVAFTPGIVIGTWVGASDPSIHFGSANGTGGRLALPIAGSALAGIQRSTRLRSKHMLSFPGIPGDSLSMDCDPRRSGTAVGRLLDGLFGGKDTTDKRDVDTTEKKKGLFRQLFPKKGE